MKRICIMFVAFTITLQTTGVAQDKAEKGAIQCSAKKQSMGYVPNLRSSFANPIHRFDVLKYTLNLNIYNCFNAPYPKSFDGSEVVTFRVDSSLSVITLDAVNTSLTIDSVTMAGVSFVHSSNKLTVTLDRAYVPGEVAEVKIYYRHNNVTDYAFYASNGMVFTDCEPEGARSWFPCWDKPSDKALLDLTAKVPSTVKLGSNGRLADSTTVADTTYFHWVSADPIATYLIVMSGKVGYNLDIVYWHKLSNPSDSVPMRFYWNSGESVSNLNNIKSKIIPMTTQYSTLFGEHPFEKNGFATLNSQFAWGGMENQTLTSLCPDCWSENLVSHEFAHQWFGDMITCGTWADIWLNEGFATYCEALWYEYTGGYSSYKADINNDANSYLSGNPGWPIYNPSWAVTTPPTDVLFNYAITYAKGACVLHMLRYTLGDSTFFAAFKAYATDTANFRLKNALTADFLTKINQSTGQDMSWFINEWVYQPNHPVYQNTYNITSLASGQWLVGFRARQTQTNTVFFTMPLEIKLRFAAGPDSLIRIMNTTNWQTFAFRCDRQPTSLFFDPSNNIVIKQATTTVGTTLSTPPALSSPPNNSLDQPRETQCVWNTAVSAATYHLQVSIDSLFGMFVINDSTLADTSSGIGALGYNTTYYWKVKAKNSGGATAWSTVWKFTTIPPPVVPTPVVLVSPDSGATGQPVTPTLVWHPLSDAIAYHLQVDSSASFTTMVVDDSILTDTTQMVGPFTGERTYYWRVRGRTASVGWNPYSPTWSFTTDTTVLLTMKTIGVRARWNILSVPLAVTDYSKNALFPTATSNAFIFDSATYVVQAILHNGKGYWLKFTNTDSVTFTGSLLPRDTVSVRSGWNMVGSISEPVAASSITSDPPGLITSEFYGYDNKYVVASTIEPGRGYWVKVHDSGGSLILSSILPSSARAKSAIRIVPASELPPLPPDATWSTGSTNVPLEYKLDQAYPNPFNPTTTIKYQLPVSSTVSLKVYNLLGQVVAVLLDGVQEAGYRSVEWNASGVTSGVYFYRLDAASVNDPNRTFVQIRKTLLMK